MRLCGEGLTCDGQPVCAMIPPLCVCIWMYRRRQRRDFCCFGDGQSWTPPSGSAHNVAGGAWGRVHPGWGQGAGLLVTRTEHKGGQHRPPPQVPHQAPITQPPRPRANDRDDHCYWKRNWPSMLKGCHGNLLRPLFSANHRAVGTMVDVAQTALQWSRLILYWINKRAAFGAISTISLIDQKETATNIPVKPSSLVEGVKNDQSL